MKASDPMVFEGSNDVETYASSWSSAEEVVCTYTNSLSGALLLLLLLLLSGEDRNASISDRLAESLTVALRCSWMAEWMYSTGLGGLPMMLDDRWTNSLCMMSDDD